MDGNWLTVFDGQEEGGMEISRHFALFMLDLAGAGERSPELFLAAGLVSRYTEEGNVCLDLPLIAGRPVAEVLDGAEIEMHCPPVPYWIDVLRNTTVVGRPGEFKPLILDEKGRLYLYRYWEYEKNVADSLTERASRLCPDIDEALLEDGIRRLFPNPAAAGAHGHAEEIKHAGEIKYAGKNEHAGGNEPTGKNQPAGMNNPAAKDDPDWQKIAALTAVRRMFCVISGGPGAGKTSTVVKVLALLLEQAKGKALRIAMAAPTGKAAARLKESIRQAKGELACQPDILKAIPDEVSTIHRLLGTITTRDPFLFRNGEENMLPCDVVVVDEASMVDLPLMARLVKAVPQGARLIILGDKDQLASVEAGAVLGDICGAGQSHLPLAFTGQSAIDKETAAGMKAGMDTAMAGPISIESPSPAEVRGGAGALRDSLVILRKSYRFGPDSGIGLVSRSINEGRGAAALSLLKGLKGGLKGLDRLDELGGPYELPADGYGDISWRRCPSPGAMPKAIAERITQGYADYLKVDDPEEAFRRFNGFRILCALRKGPYGVERVNGLVEEALQKAGLIPIGRDRVRGRQYRGQPVMITRNDYRLGLFNGDVGLILPDPSQSGALYAYFPTSDGAMRKIPPGRLPEHEAVYAMTVHKSQGSEFDRVIFLLPDVDAEVLTRELIYTSITRAREYVEVWGREEVFIKAISRRIQRQSGLQDALWGEGA
ncbi:MAG: exodeoxyribonuclease V subunit alpha [bacterium]